MNTRISGGVIAALALIILFSFAATSYAREGEAGDDRGNEQSAGVTSGMPVPGTRGVEETEVKDDSESESMNDDSDGNGSDDSDSSGNGMGEEHKSEVAKAVAALLEISDRDRGIGDEVREVAREHASSSERISEEMKKVESRNAWVIFLFGSDYKTLGGLKSELETSLNSIDRLTKAAEKTTDAEVKADLQAQITTLESAHAAAENFVKENEDKFSLLGWLFKFFAE